MSLPSLPPHPHQQSRQYHHQHQNPPPVPPLPPNFVVQPDQPHPYESQPHFSQPLAAPRPQKLDPDLPANMARTLDDNLGHRVPMNQSPGFAYPVPSSTPRPPQQNEWSPWNPASSPGPNPGYPQQPYPPQPHPQSMSALPPQPNGTNALPSLTAPLPSTQTLSGALPTIQHPSHDPALKVAWARDVLFLVDRSQQNSSSSDVQVGPVQIADPQLLRLAQVAVPLVLQIASSAQQGSPSSLPPHVAEAVYLRATLAASGGFPDFLQHNPRSAFRDFEQAARGGYSTAWFRLGRDYENFNDGIHARDCFERGVKQNVESCVYRMGMAHLMGQLGLQAQPEAAIPLLHRAATLATVQVPQPAYVYGLLLLGEFSHITVPPQLFAAFVPRGSSPAQEARKHLERAAYLNFAPAQYKLGHAYEFAQAPFPFDALLSVQYYSLASQQGEIEADMALSKWFLCGAEGSFEKDEALAFTFAEKAARKGLPSAEFAMGYYTEVGVGGQKDIEVARQWYTKASEHGNADAVERLAALNQPSPQALSRQEHDNITESKLVRKRTQAKQRSERTDGTGSARPSMEESRQVVDVIRKNSFARQPHGPGPASVHALSPVPEQRPQMGYPSQPGLGPSPGSAPHPSLAQNANVVSPRMQNNGPRQFPNQHRYTLVDPGSSSAGSPPNSRPPSRVHSPHGRPAGRPPAQRVPSGPSPGVVGGPPQPGNSPHMGPSQPMGSPAPMPNGPVPIDPSAVNKNAHKSPTTFAEMGIQGAKLEEKECVIM